jgi:predicted RNA-binding Zn ribbon-like protein
MASPDTIHLWGGALCLDFANTVDWSDMDEPRGRETDALGEPDDVVRWGRRLEILTDGAPADVTDDELAACHALRAAVHATFAAIASGKEPPATALDTLTGTLAEAAAAGRLVPHAHAWVLAWPPADARQVRFSAAVDAVAMLADPARLARVRRCPGRGCGWLFLDASGRRRWCSMQTCGSRAKMRRLYERRRSASAAG